MPWGARAMSDYSYPYKDAEFIFNELIDFDRLCEQGGLDEINTELATAVLEEANYLAAVKAGPDSIMALTADQF